MRLKVFVVVAMTLLFAINLFWVKVFQRQRYEVKQPQSRLEKRHVRNELFYYSSVHSSAIQFSFCGIEIPNKMVYVGRDTLNVVSLVSVAREPKLAFYIPHNACAPCIESAFSCIDNVFTRIERDARLIIIASHLDHRVKASYYSKPVISFVKGTMDIEIERFQLPFFFVLDDDSRLDMLFVHEKAFPEVTEAYLRIVKERFQKDNRKHL